ncbi:MAG: prevent-host-death protein [Spirochaetaceae bacterium]|nr:MAG: prevent-host-death protein [Spirochaetaceae bacterium]
MKQVNMLDPKTHLSRLISEIEEHREDEIIIARNGHPVARLQAVGAAEPDSALRRVGAARGAFVVPHDIDTPYGELNALFSGSPSDIE